MHNYMMTGNLIESQGTNYNYTWLITHISHYHQGGFTPLRQSLHKQWANTHMGQSHFTAVCEMLQRNEWMYEWMNEWMNEWTGGWKVHKATILHCKAILCHEPGIMRWNLIWIMPQVQDQSLSQLERWQFLLLVSSDPSVLHFPFKCITPVTYHRKKKFWPLIC